MNDVVSTGETTTANRAMVVLKGAVSTILANDKENILGKLAEEIAAFKPDATTPAGRKAIASMAFKVASTKMDLIRLGKGLTEDWRKQTKAVNDECKVVEERMDALKEQVRAPLTAYENREKARVDAHNEAIHALALIDPGLGSMTSHQITMEIARRTEMPNRDWEEFAERARFEHGVVMRTLNTWRKVAEEREEAAAEAERQRAREAAEAARLQAEREEQIRNEAAAKAKAAADAAAEAARVAEAERVEQERLEAQKAAAARLAEAQAEAERVAREAVEAEERRAEHARQEAEAARLAALEAEERAQRAEEQRVAAEEKAEAERLQAAFDRMNAEKAAAAKAEQEKQEAVDAERHRQRMEAAKAQREAEERERNVAHRRKINGAAADAIMEAMSEEHPGTAAQAQKIAQAIVKAIALRKVPNVTIQY